MDSAAEIPGLTPAQRSAALSRDPLHVVSAGAGSGKTRVLVERVVALAKDGIGPDRLLAITFTEKGAAELRRRIIARLESEGLDAARRAAEAAYISTIHGFCARVLREWPVEAGLDPSFGILDDVDAALFHSDRLDALWGDEEFETLAREYGGSSDDRKGASRTHGSRGSGSGEPALFRIIRKVLDTWRELGRQVDELERAADPDVLTKGALDRSREYAGRRWRDMLELLRGAERLTSAHELTPAAGEKYARLCGLIATLRPGEPHWEMAWELWDCIGFYTSLRKEPRKGEWKARLEPARDIADSMRKRHPIDDEALDRESARRAALVMRWAAALWRDFDRFKAERNLLDYQDLQLAALRMLGATPAALREYRRRFAHILLDEAQDTNRLQYTLLQLLWTGNNAWFVVGDAKQAIYGFRNAEPEQFLKLTKKAGTHVTDLTENFRSRAELLQMVNAAGHAFWDAVPAMRFKELAPAYDYLPGGTAPRVELCVVDQRERAGEGGSGGGDERDDEDDHEERGAAAKRQWESIDVAREREARWIAERLQRLERERYQICDEDPDTHAKFWRDFGWSDAAILVRTRSAFPAIRRVLRDAGIPLAVVGGSGFFDGLEVRDLLNGLRLLANPRDDSALLAALRSPLCAVDDDTLLALRQARDARRAHDDSAAGANASRRAGRSRRDRAPLSFWDAIHRAPLEPAAREKVDEFTRTVLELRELRDALPPSELLHRLVERTDYLARVVAGDHARERAANVARLDALARAHDAMSLREFLEYAARAAAHLSDSADAPLAEPGDQVVTLCTVHRAKGLEWPVVFLADLARDYWEKMEHSTVSHDGTVLLSVVAGRDKRGKKIWTHSLGTTEIREHADTESAAEAQRLFYVGTTRARELLIMSGVAEQAGTPRAKSWSPTAGAMHAPLPWLCAHLGLDPKQGVRPGTVKWDRATVQVTCVDAATDPHPQRIARTRSLSELYARQLRDGLPLGDQQPDDATTARALARLTPRIVDQRAAEQLSVTRLAGYLRCELVYRYSELGVPEYPARPLGVHASGASFGDALHRALADANFAAVPAAEADRLVSRLVSENALEEEDAQNARRLIEATLSSEVALEIRRSTDVRREIPFFVPLADDAGTADDGAVASQPILRGIIDLLFRDADGAWHIVDWKSNAVKDDRRYQLLVMQYTPQVQLYAAALRLVPGFERVASGRLVFLQPRRVEQIPVAEDVLRTELARARRAAERIGRGDYATHPGLKCVECGYQRGKWCAVGVEYVQTMTHAPSAILAHPATHTS